MASAPATTRNTGARYEDLALVHLEANGLRLLDRNFNCRYGEIDLVMQHARTIVFVEVRYRRGAAAGARGFGDGVDSISAAKRGKLARAASIYLAAHPRLANHACRFDVVAIADRAIDDRIGTDRVEADRVGADAAQNVAIDWRANAFDAV